MIGFSGAMMGTNQDATDPNIAACQDSADSVPAGISTRPIAMAKSTKVSLPGSTANLKIAARAAARQMPAYQQLTGRLPARLNKLLSKARKELRRR